MKESTGWMLLAEDIGAAPECNDMWLCLILENLEHFPSADCGYMRFVEKGKTIPFSVVEKMRERFNSHIDWDNRVDYCYDGPSSWYNDSGVRYDGSFNCRRALACIWLSLEAKEEGC